MNILHIPEIFMWEWESSVLLSITGIIKDQKTWNIWIFPVSIINIFVNYYINVLIF